MEIRKQVELAGFTLCAALIEYIHGAISEEVMNLYRDTYADDILTIIDEA